MSASAAARRALRGIRRGANAPVEAGPAIRRGGPRRGSSAAHALPGPQPRGRSPQPRADARSRRRQEGTVLIYVTLGLLAFFGLAALATDTGFVFQTKSQLQNATDAAALAAAGEMLTSDATVLDKAAGLAAAQTYGQTHYAGTVPVQIRAEDVEFGRWDMDTRTFTPLPGSNDADEVRAVRVTGRRDTFANGPVGTVLGRIIGTNSIEVSTTAVAFVGCAGDFPSGEFDLPIAVDCCALAGPDCKDFCEELADTTPMPCDDDPTVSCLEFYETGDQNACWTVFDGQHSAVSSGDLKDIIRRGNTFPVRREPVYLDNGTKTSVLKDIEDKFDDVGDTNGDRKGDSWVVGLPVVQCQSPGPHCAGGTPQMITGGVCFEIERVVTKGDPKYVRGRFLCPGDPGYDDCGFDQTGPGGECYGVPADRVVLVD